VIISEDDPQLETWSEKTGKTREWLEEAKPIAVASYRMILEDGPDVCNSESSAACKNHGEELENMHFRHNW
jgi:hypothetical protein